MINRKKIIAIILFLLTSLLIFTFANTNNDPVDTLAPVVTVSTSNVYTMEVHTTIPTFTATAEDDIDEDVDVIITNNIDKDIVGDYTVTFLATDSFGNEATITKDFKVVDTTKPIISLIGNTTYKRLLGYDTYIDENANATDNYDVAKIISGVTLGSKTVVGSYKLLYNYTDANGNEATEVVRTIKLLAANADEDSDGYTNLEEFKSHTNYNNASSHPSYSAAPTIKISESNIYTMEVHGTIPNFVATATDAADGNVLVVVTHNINKDVLSNSYVVTFTAKDSLGNTTTINKNFKVVDTIMPTVTYNSNGNLTFESSNITQVTVEDANLDITSLNYIWTQSSIYPTDWSSALPFTSGSLISTPSNGNGEYYLHVIAKDIANNIVNATSNVFKLDNILPTVSFEPNGSSKYKTSQSTIVTVFDINLDTTGLKYMWTTSTTEPSWTAATIFTNGDTITTPSNISGNYYLHIQASDTAGNTSHTVSDRFKVDNIAPTVSFSPNGGNNKFITWLELSDIGSRINYDDSQYMWTTSATEPTNWDGHKFYSPIMFVMVPMSQGTHYLWVYTIDNLGNAATYSSEAFLNDTIRPTITITPDGNNTYKQSHTAVVNVTDVNLDTTSLKYIWRTDTNTHFNWNSAVSFVTGDTIMTPSGVNGSYYLHVKATDFADNTTHEVSRAFKLDNTLPSVTYDQNGNTTFTHSHNTKVFVSDGRLVGNSLKYKWTQSSVYPTDWSDGTPFTSGNKISTPVNGTGDFYLHVYAADTAGNVVNATSNVFKIDNTKPTVTYNLNGGLNIPTTVVTVTEEHTGLKTDSLKYMWTTSTTEPTDWTSGISFTSGDTISVPSTVAGNYYLWVYASDNIDNEGATSSEMFIYDMENPLISFNPNGDSTYKKVSSTIVTVNDANLDLTSLLYKWTTESLTPTDWSDATLFTSGETINTPSGVTGMYYLHIEAKDLVNNVSHADSNVFKVDNTKPYFTTSNEDISIEYHKKARFYMPTVTASDDESGLASITYIWEDSNGNTVPGLDDGEKLKKSDVGTYTLIYTATDNAGNTETDSVIVTIYESSH